MKIFDFKFFIAAAFTGLLLFAGGCKKTPEAPKTLPVLQTAAAENITTNAATLGGVISHEGLPPYTERGVCWGTSSNPTTAAAKVAVQGTGTGAFSTAVTGLSPNTTYYVRAYATVEGETFYGNQQTFTTLAQPVGNGDSDSEDWGDGKWNI